MKTPPWGSRFDRSIIRRAAKPGITSAAHDLQLGFRNRQRAAV